MSSTARPEYVTDVPYVRCFENDLSPAQLRLAAARGFHARRPEDDFDYCELGSAHGDTTVTLAAAHPRARFVGVDLNPDHIASANGLAAGGRLENIRFLERDFEGLASADLPDFDFITAHGVMSWVSPAKQKALLSLAAAKLKPGGILHVSYNALPGWAAVEPLRQLIAGRAALVTGRQPRAGAERRRLREADERPRRGVLHEQSGRTSDARKDGAARAVVRRARVPPRALGADVLRPGGVGCWPRDGLYFVGQLPLYLNYRDLAIPEKLAPMFAGTLDRVAFESLKDFAINEYFRRDVFVKGRGSRDANATQTYLDGTLFGAPLQGGVVPREAKLPHHTLHYAGPIFDALAPAIDEGRRPSRRSPRARSFLGVRARARA